MEQPPVALLTSVSMGDSPKTQLNLLFMMLLKTECAAPDLLVFRLVQHSKPNCFAGTTGESPRALDREEHPTCTPP
ncbi:hypothetical protein T265_00464 [Opisthorchis viverrini]|uniref:Uncharacterized protein n=1 Tax=Opisthorchis viverrini TaxID=6198 RepID=A0A075A261_OPIVI|nr:hypothetical protein T265_00464 [Opisthorchis viverrini]KER33798.1 hypothetical protein T265_00464 [Opisthorchis viverrini]